MDIISVLAAIFVVVVTTVLLYVVYMSRDYLVLKKMEIPSISPWPGIGNLPEISKIGMIEFYSKYYKKFTDEKVFGVYEPGKINMVVKDLDMMRDIMVKNFNSFVNRKRFPSGKPFSSMMTLLIDDQWRHVRNAVSPTFSTGKLKQMGKHVEHCTKGLVSNLQESCEKNKEIELKDVVSCYTLDVIAGTGFGVSIDSQKDPSSPFVKNAKEIMNFGGKQFAIAFLFPFVIEFLGKFAIGIFPKKPSDFFCSFVDAAIENRKGAGEAHSNKNDFIQLVINEEKKQKESKNEEAESKNQQNKGLTHEEIQGQGIIFILAGYDTVSTVMSFTLFSLANNPEICAIAQQEIDTVLQGKFPTYESVQSLPYLDMCLNEAMRMYPPGFVIDRQCTQDCVVQGVKIPRGMHVVFPIMAIHNDPQYFPEPEKFDPQRFSEENKSSRHPYAHLPFGQGPRNCIGMRLALAEMKVALAGILQEVTPVTCDKTVYPAKLSSFQMKAEDGLWVKLISRKK